MVLACSLAWPNVSPCCIFCQKIHVNPQTSHHLAVEQRHVLIRDLFIHHCSQHCYDFKTKTCFSTQHWFLLFIYLTRCIFILICARYNNRHPFQCILYLASAMIGTQYNSSFCLNCVNNKCSIFRVVEVIAEISGVLRMAFPTFIYRALPSTSFQMEFFFHLSEWAKLMGALGREEHCCSFNERLFYLHDKLILLPCSLGADR